MPLSSDELDDAIEANQAAIADLVARAEALEASGSGGV